MSQPIRLSSGAVIMASQISGVVPRGEYPDEVTLVMRNGDRFSTGSGYNKTRQQTFDHWVAVMRAASVKGGAE